MAEIGKYVYGIINSNTTSHLGNDGVYTIPHRDVSFMVKDCEIFDYASVPNDIGVKMLLKHQEVIERIMDSGISVIPVQLGTFIRDETEVKRVLDKGYGLIKEILDKINDKIEVNVAVIWNDFASVLKEIGEGNEIKKFKDELLTCSEEITTDDRIKIGAMVGSMLVERREEYSLQIHDILNKISENVRTHDVMDDKMILNSAFLINKN
ncbi:MAG: GvpL/GvpF family gas vesicle protein, partial [bacterium]